jgi:hypothetical protein
MIQGDTINYLSFNRTADAAKTMKKERNTKISVYVDDVIHIDTRIRELLNDLIHWVEGKDFAMDAAKVEMTTFRNGGKEKT